MTHNIDVQLFNEPSGNIRGIAICLMTFGKREERVAHATLFVNLEPEVTLNVPKRKITASEVLQIANALGDFHNRIKEA